MEDFGPSRLPLPPEVDLKRPSVARVYDFFLGGGHNTEADREAARAMSEVMPGLPAVLRANRAFVHRAVTFLVDVGVRQFLDLGSGLATEGAVHEIAADRGVNARVLYVDNDPVVAAHNTMLLPAESAAAVQADLRDADRVLHSPQARELFDPGEPVGVLMIAVLHFVPHQDDPAAVVVRYRDAVAPGSYLALTHAEDSNRLTGTFEAARRYSAQVAPIHLRSRAEIATLLDGWDLVQPGLVDTPDWRPDRDREGCTPPLNGLAAVARKPARSRHDDPEQERAEALARLRPRPPQGRAPAALFAAVR